MCGQSPFLYYVFLSLLHTASLSISFLFAFSFTRFVACPLFFSCPQPYYMGFPSQFPLFRGFRFLVFITKFILSKAHCISVWLMRLKRKSALIRNPFQRHANGFAFFLFNYKLCFLLQPKSSYSFQQTRGIVTYMLMFFTMAQLQK